MSEQDIKKGVYYGKRIVYPVATINHSSYSFSLARVIAIGSSNYYDFIPNSAEEAYLSIMMFKIPFLIKCNKTVSNSGLHRVDLVDLDLAGLELVKLKEIYRFKHLPLQHSDDLRLCSPCIAWKVARGYQEIWLVESGGYAKPTLSLSTVPVFNYLQGHLEGAKFELEMTEDVDVQPKSFKIYNHTIPDATILATWRDQKYYNAVIMLSNNTTIASTDHDPVTLQTGTWWLRHPRLAD